jgi:arylsulfatase A-like enzyme
VILGSALVGGFMSLIEAPAALSRSGTLPVTTQLLTLAAAWYVYALVGLLLAAVFAGARRLLDRGGAGRPDRGAWPAWFSLACLLFLTMVARSAYTGSLTGTSVVVSALAGVAAFVVLAAVGPRAPGLRSVRLWGLLNVVLLLVAAVRLTLAGPFAHGVSPAGMLALLPALCVASLPLFGRGARRRVVVLAVPVAIAVTLAICLGLPAAPRPDTGSAGRTNVLLISIDTLRSDHLGCYGNDRVATPHIDRLAAEGVLFENAVSPMPQTNPTHTTMLTGLNPVSHGVLFNRYIHLPGGVVSLPEVLAGNGYATAAFVSGSTLERSVSTLWERFELYEDDFSPYAFLPAGTMRFGVCRLLRRAVKMAGGRTRVTPDRRSAGAALSKVERWLADNAGAPFFLFVHFFDPHGPYDPPPPYDLMYDPSYSGNLDGDWYALSPDEKRELTEDPVEVAHMSARYAGEVSYADANVGVLLARLEELGLLERTLVVLTSDHGESLTEHGYYFDHGAYLYEVSLGVPLIVRLPGGENGGTRREELVTLADIAPTTLDYLGISNARDTDGRSVANLCFSPAAGEGFAERVVHSAVHRGDTRDEASLLSVRTLGHKFIRTSAHLENGETVPQLEELYDLSSDPGETLSLAASEPGLLLELRSLADPLWGVWVTTEGGEAAPLSEESREALRALGYVQ